METLKAAQSPKLPFSIILLTGAHETCLTILTSSTPLKIFSLSSLTSAVSHFLSRSLSAFSILQGILFSIQFLMREVKMFVEKGKMAKSGFDTLFAIGERQLVVHVQCDKAVRLENQKIL